MILIKVKRQMMVLPFESKNTKWLLLIQDYLWYRIQHHLSKELWYVVASNNWAMTVSIQKTGL